MGSGGSAGNLHNIQYMRHNGDQKKSHVELLNEAIATPLKKCEWIGEQGGGEKSVKFWSEMMPQRPVGQKNVSNWQTQIMVNKPKNQSDWQTIITVNKEKYPKGFAGKGSGLGFDSFVSHPQSQPQFTQLEPEFHSNDQISQSNQSQPEIPQKSARFANQETLSITSSRSELITGKLHQSFPGGPCGPITGPNLYTRMSKLPAPKNPFKISRPATSILYKKQPKPTATQANPPFPTQTIIGHSTNWSKFCLGNLGPKSSLACLSCNYTLCTQAQVKPHTFQWYKARNQERNMTGFGEDDCDGG